MYRLLFIISILFICAQAFACSCHIPETTTFCDSMSQFTDLNSRVIVVGKVSIDNQGMVSIEVQNEIIGKAKSNNIALGYGGCDIRYIPIKDNEEYLFALREYDNRYFIFGCAISYLKVEGNDVVGRIAPGVERFKIDKLSEIIECGSAFKSFSDQIEVYPNPTSDALNIKNLYSENSFDDAQIRIYDTSGKVVGYRKNNVILEDESWEIYIEDLPSGVYLIQIINQFNSATKKVVKI